jgi:hypothetical protein
MCGTSPPSRKFTVKSAGLSTATDNIPTAVNNNLEEN